MTPSPTLDALEAALAASFPVTHDGATLSSLGLEQAPEGPRTTLRLEMRDGDEVIWLVEQLIDLAGVDVHEILAWPGRARERLRERLREGDPTDACVMPMALLVPPFRPLPRPQGEPEAWVAEITEALREQAWGSGFEARFDRLDVWPVVPRTAYFLDHAHAMLGGNGLEVYLAQQCFEDVSGVLEALEAAGCEGLALRMRQGIALSQEEGGSEFLVQVDDDWLEEHGRPVPEGEGRAWERLDSHERGGTWWLVEHELRPALDAYVQAHLPELLEPQPQDGDGTG